MTTEVGFGLFVALDESDAPNLVERMTADNLAVSGERYGIYSRLIARPDATVASIGAATLRKLISHAKLSPSSIDTIVLSSRIRSPSEEAERLVHQLDHSANAVGIERACSGFPAAVKLAKEIVEQRNQTVAVVTAEIISCNINWEEAKGDLADQSRARGQASKLFADGAAACLIGPWGAKCPHQILDAWQDDVADDKQLIQKLDVVDSIDPWGQTRPGTTECISMPGRRGFWLVRRAPEIMSQAIERSRTQLVDRQVLSSSERVHHIVPHQPNGLILDRLAALIESENEHGRVWKAIEHAGNTVSASIPTTMATAQRQISAEELVAMPSVGAGGPGYRPDVLSTGCVLTRWGRTNTA